MGFLQLAESQGLCTHSGKDWKEGTWIKSNSNWFSLHSKADWTLQAEFQSDPITQPERKFLEFQESFYTGSIFKCRGMG